ncbi:MAG: methyltransferase domain-containing protein [Bacteroidia bacterium]|nr:methyltransferase domain-containing protein [Bacteroidia bacterium]HRB85037.1 methyltransferase domain-containing protein [Bacteroidia bacterium]
MGSQQMQSKLWGQRPKDWATIQEPTGKIGYEHALEFIKLQPIDKLLDIGCGTGYFISLAAQSGAEIIGFDATGQFIEEAKQHNPSVKFLVGEMEELPFADDSFDIVTGFNSFQYASDVKNALMQAKRVLKKEGKIVVMVWGNKEDCDIISFLKAIGSLMPPPPSGSPGPFALTENHLLERILEDIGFKILNVKDVDSIWDYPDTETAIKGLLSAGPSAKAIEHAGFENVVKSTLGVIKSYSKSNGHIVFANKFRIVIAEK